MKLDVRINFRCTKLQKETYKAVGGAKFLRKILSSVVLTTDEMDEIIYQEGTKLFKKVSEK